VHHSQPAASLIQGDEKAVYGDKAYASEALRTKLAAAGIEDRVMYRAARDTPLKSWQSWFNKAVAGIRAGVERRFAVINYGFRPGALPRPPPQRLPSAAVVHRDQPQARPGDRRTTAGVCLNDEKNMVQNQ
jgi:IS5 family transposase